MNKDITELSLKAKKENNDFIIEVDDRENVLALFEKRELIEGIHAFSVGINTKQVLESNKCSFDYDNHFITCSKINDKIFNKFLKWFKSQGLRYKNIPIKLSYAS